MVNLIIEELSIPKISLINKFKDSGQNRNNFNLNYDPLLVQAFTIKFNRGRDMTALHRS